MTDAARLPVIAVHGFMYDPADKGGSNDPAPFFDEMSGITGRPVVGFPWYSAPFGLRAARPLHSLFQTTRSWLASWAKGKLDPYKLAWSLALRAGDDLVIKILNTPGPVDLVGHSLGARVVLRALPQLPEGKVRRVILFNGAELCRNAYEPVALTDAAILNIAVRRDQVLKLLGSRFSGDGAGDCVGRVGLVNPPGHWRDVFIDKAGVRARALQRRGWTLRGDAPGDFLDHSESYRFAGNADLVRAWLAGDELDDLAVIR